MRGVRLTMLSSLAMAGPALASGKRMAPPSRAMDLFVLAPDRMTPPHMATVSTPAALPQAADDATDEADMLVEAAAPGGNVLKRLLAIRPDLRFIINGGIRDVRRERIALGLYFARAF